MGASSATQPAIRRRKRNQHTTDLDMGDVVASFSPTHISTKKRTEIICLSISSFAIPDRRGFFCVRVDDVTTKGITIHVTIDQLFRLATIVRL